MREWISEQGIMLYIFASVTIIGLIATAIANRGYKRLIKEADSMDNAENRLVKYIKLKYSSYYKIGLKPNDSKALVNRYLYKYRIGPFTLNTWAKTGLAALGVNGIAAVVNMLMRFFGGEALNTMYPMLGTALLCMFALYVQNRLCAFKDKQDAFRWTMYDYLNNFLKNKIECGKTLENKAASERVQAAATTVGRPREGAAAKAGGRSYDAQPAAAADEEIDARIVEDILKEFLN